jgi:hypothetical protein
VCDDAVQITPKPTPAERAAILAALGALASNGMRGEWWRAGLPGDADERDHDPLLDA